MKKYNINYWLSRSFKNTDCKDYLEHFISKYKKIFRLIDWCDYDYEKQIYGINIKYTCGGIYNRDINVIINANNSVYFGTMEFSIKNSGNRVIVIDNMNTFNKYEPDNPTTITSIGHNINYTYDISSKKYLRYNTNKEELLCGSKIILSSKDNQVLYYNEYTGTNNNNMSHFGRYIK